MPGATTSPTALIPTALIRTALILSALLAACSALPAAPADVTLQVMMAEDWAGTPAVLDVVRAFEAERPGVRIELIPRPFSQIPEDAAAAAAAGQPVDVVHHHAFAAGATGLAEPLTRWWADGTFDEDAHFPGAVQDVVWGDTPYGVPLDVNALLVVRDGDVPAPRTFAEVRALAEEAAAEGERALTVSSNSWEAYGWIAANGGEVVHVAADGTPTFTLEDPRTVEALDFLGDLVADGLAYGPVTRDVSTDAFALFAAGDTRLLATGTWDVAQLHRTVPEMRHRTAPMPRGGSADDPADPGDPTGSALGGSSLFAGRGSDQVDLAVAFMQAMTADDVAVRLALEEGRFPPRPHLYDRLGDAPGARPLAIQLETATPMRLIAFPEADAAFADALDAVLTGRAGAAEALAEAQAIATASLGAP
jgi:multiple sugar transport system substrate-binding protein